MDHVADYIEFDPKLETEQVTPELIDYIVQKIVERLCLPAKINRKNSELNDAF